MASYNRIVLLGNLTRDPQLSYTPNNTAVCKFGIATNRKWKDRDGNMREDVCFVDCTVFGRGGETFNQYMSKGRAVLVEGRLELSQWTTPEGEKRSRHGVVVENFTFLGGGRTGDAPRQPAEAHAGGSAAPAEASGPGYDSPPPPTDADIPF
ncbi:MAG: single-stranded DNA-binding protein [Planctomycetota bacterium]|jgi:single-strand DNA-binding protein